jgi:hypothetical protein
VHPTTERFGEMERDLEADPEQHHVVARSRGGSNKPINLTPADPRRHDRYHDITGNSLPTETLRMLATDTVGYGRNRTIEPRRLETVYQIATMIDWPELYKPGAVTPSGTVESLARRPRSMFRHATAHQVEELFHLDAAMNGLDHGKGFGWQKARLLTQFMKFAGTPDDPVGAMKTLLTEEYEGRLTWVDAMQDVTRADLLSALEGAELVELTQNAEADLRVIVSKQRSKIQRHYEMWMKTYEANYGQGRKKKRETKGIRGNRR